MGQKVVTSKLNYIIIIIIIIFYLYYSHSKWKTLLDGFEGLLVERKAPERQTFWVSGVEEDYDEKSRLLDDMVLEISENGEPKKRMKAEKS